MGFLSRFFRRFTRSDEEVLAEETLLWASTVPGSVRISEAPLRSQVKLAGVVERITVRPTQGFQALEAVLSDGTGEVTSVWLGRTSIRGLVLGSRVIVEGVLGEDHGVRRVVNPGYEFG